MLVERFESSLYETSSLLLATEGEAVLVDPAVTRDEIGCIGARADTLGLRVAAVLATHVDWDHVCGIAAFPDAEAAMGERTAGFVASGAAAARLVASAARAGVEVGGPPRCDRSLAPGVAHEIGPFVVETLALPGHTSDSTGYRIHALDLLVVGDYLSARESPYVSSTAAYRATLALLIDLLRCDPPGRVFPGHGPEHSAGEALAIAEADLDYLTRLHDAVLAGGREAGLTVELPRAPEDEEMRIANVETQLEELAAT